jgi:hypothetical protein
MKFVKCIAVSLFTVLSVSSFSQNLNNAIKINLSSLALKNFSFQYERGLTSHISVALGFRVEPDGTIPLHSFAEKVFDKSDFNLDDFKMGNTAITPEVRFYLGHGKQRGFYIAPYARYASFNLSLPINYSSGNGNQEALFDGHINSFSGGMMFGMQYTFGKMVVLDIWLVGAHYGSSNGNATFVAPGGLSPDDQQSLQQKLDNINIKPFNFTGTVTANGATIQTNGPWVGIRALGINLGIRF